MKASVELASDATLRSVSFERPSRASASAEAIRKLSMSSVEASLRGAQYRTECGGRTVVFAFDFRLSRGPDEDGRVVFVYPDRFQVSDTTRVVDFDNASGDSGTPAAAPRRRR